MKEIEVQSIAFCGGCTIMVGAIEDLHLQITVGSRLDYNMTVYEAINHVSGLLERAILSARNEALLDQD